MPGETEKSTTALVLFFIGGIFVLLTGLATGAIGWTLTFFLGGLGGIFGLLVTRWGVLMIIRAVMLYSNLKSHAMWGSLIIVCFVPS